MPRSRIAVVGAGLQGATVALALAARGHPVILLERRGAPMLAASRRNEGKIHLGFVYALDPSGATRRRMLEGALTFGPLLDDWCGPLPWAEWRSEGFRYARMPDSLASPGALDAAYEHVRALVPEVTASAPCRAGYLGQKLDWCWRRSAGREGGPLVGGRPIDYLVETEEVSIDPHGLADAIARRVSAHPAIELRCDTRVREAERRHGGFRLFVETSEGPRRLDVDLVANCAWEDRANLDRGVGAGSPEATTCYRVKYQILVRPPRRVSGLRPVTMVQGPYGDVVPWRDGLVSVSWYPESCTYFGAAPPADGLDDPETAGVVARRTLEALAELFPDLRGAAIVSSAPGIIVAPGLTDIDDLQSGLHRRDAFGVRAFDGWWSVDPGKLTTAPLVALATADEIHGSHRRVLA